MRQVQRSIYRVHGKINSIMETYYSIVKIAPNPSAGDSLSVGLILRNRSGFRFHFSDRKTKAAKQLLYENGEAVDFIVKQIAQTIKEINKELPKHSELFSAPSLITSDYFSYLNNYCNGILQFGKPAMLLDDEVSQEKFMKLFEVLVDKEPIEESRSIEAKEKKFIRTIERKLINRVKDKVHTHIKIDNKTIESMYYQFEIDCIGINVAFVGAKSLPFTKSPQTLDMQISHYTNLITFLSVSRKKEFAENHFYLIADEPATVGSPEHKIWDSIQKQSLFKVINSEQSDVVAQVIEETQAKKFLAD